MGNGNRVDFHYDEQGRKTTIHKFATNCLGLYEPGVGMSVIHGELLRRALGVPVGGSVTTVYDEHDQQTEWCSLRWWR